MKTILICNIMFALSFIACREKATDKVSNVDSDVHRPLYHFTPDSMWMNDPNGLVYHNGEYHLFYQYYPDSTVWGPMHWGHAVSRDLVSWEHLPIALYPDSLGYIFSGSCVIDRDNTAGFGANAMIAIFTHHNMEKEKAGNTDFQYQSLAWSGDNGRTFTKYQGNPVVKNPGIRDFRDPKVRWDTQRKQWVMVFAAYDKVLLYTSPDLKTWSMASSFGIEGDKRLWECPDLFPIKVEGSNETKWVLITSIQKEAPNGGTGTSYFVGEFDGKHFKADPSGQKWLDYGKDNYAFVTWSNLPDDRIIGIGWMSNWQYAQQVPTIRWRSAMTLPRQVRLKKINGSYTLTSVPDSRLFDAFEAGAATAIQSDHPVEIPKTCLIDIKWVPEDGDENISMTNLKGDTLVIGCLVNERKIYIDRSEAGDSTFSRDFAGKHFGVLPQWQDTLRLQLFLDVASIELFANNGECSMTEIFFPAEPLNLLSFGRKNQNISINFRAFKNKKGQPG